MQAAAALQVERVWNQTKENIPKKNFCQAHQAQPGMLYSFWVQDADLKQHSGMFKTGPGYVRAEYLTLGGRNASHLVFFRRQRPNGLTVLHGIPTYSLVREVERVIRED